MVMQSQVLAFLVLFHLLVALCAAQNSNQYVCNTPYEPIMYANGLGRTHVPFDCNVSIPSDCPRSWKAGVFAGRSAAEPLIDVDFIKCMEGFSECGYVPIIEKTGAVVGNSGVTIGIGVDLGTKDRSSLSVLGVENSTLDELEPYFGLQSDNAACAAIELPLMLTNAEVTSLSMAVLNDTITTVAMQYDAQRDSEALPFASLPRGIRTAIVSVFFQYGNESRVPIFWGHVISNNWEEAIKELRNLASEDDFPRRRNYEADIIEAAAVNCTRSIDAVFLLDESGSISPSDFLLSLDFIEEIISIFPDENVGGDNGTNFGLSLFSSAYRSAFFLSTFDSKDEYLPAVSGVGKLSGGTNLGAALTQILTDQFNESRGLRPEDQGIPRILIVLTDGISSDSVAIPAETIRNESIVIYAVGVGNYDAQQLSDVASSESHIYTLDSFQNLADFAGTLTAASCYESRPLNLNMTITSSVQKGAYQYFSFVVSLGDNLMIEVNDVSGSTLMFASRDNPHPSEFDNNFGFTYSTTNKVIVISPTTESSNNVRRKRQTPDLSLVYMSVTSETENSAFVLEATLCDPSECSEGTNEVVPTTVEPTAQTEQPSTSSEPEETTCDPAVCKGFTLKMSMLSLVFGLVVVFTFFRGLL